MPPFAIGNTPVTPVVKGRPVKFVATPEDGVPIAGVTSVGDVLSTTEPVPVEVVVPVPPFKTGSVPVTPVASGNPVALVRTIEEGVPKAGVINVGLLFNTSEPVPVDVVVPVPPLATGREPTTPVVNGKPVALVSTAAEGVPSAGVTRVGDVLSTTEPVPVDVVVPVPPFNTANTPVTPVDNGKPVALVRTPDDGVPKAGDTSEGVVIVGLTANTTEPVPVAVVLPVPPLTIASVPVTPVDSGKPVRFVATPDAGVPSKGAIRVGPVASTSEPVPVEVVVPVPPFTTANVPVTPVDSGKPVRLVATPDVGVPSNGVTSVGLTLSTTLPLPVDEVTPVPPLVTANNPETVITPEVGTAGSKPVVPNEIADTPVAAEKVVQPTDEYPSKAFASVEYRICPITGLGRCAVLPTGKPTAPAPGRITFVGKLIVGLPTPLPLATAICVAVPVIVIGVTLVPATASKPVPVDAAKFDIIPE